jgi:hypothetical protein
MTKLKNTLAILNANSKLFVANSKLFHEWHYDWSTEFTEDGEDHLLIKAKFFFDGAEIHICEWLWRLAPNEPNATRAHEDTYYETKGFQNLITEMDAHPHAARLAYYAFISEFNIAYNLAEGK